jgi:CHAD domain-containing protein
MREPQDEFGDATSHSRELLDLSFITDLLESVERRLRQAVRHVDEPRTLHRFRVSVRRARSAMDFFDDNSDDAKSAKFKKRLRRLFRAAGHIRRCDVALCSLAQRHCSIDLQDQLALETVILWTVEERTDAAKEFLRFARKFGAKAIRRQIDRLLRSQENEGHGLESPFTRAANQQSHGQHGGAISHYVSIAQLEFRATASDDLTDFDALHQLRIMAKQLRYALEILSSTDASEKIGLATHELSSLQDRLGEINDDRELADRIARCAAQADSILAQHVNQSGLCSSLDSIAKSVQEDNHRQQTAFVAEWQSGWRDRLVSMTQEITEAKPAKSNDQLQPVAGDAATNEPSA